MSALALVLPVRGDRDDLLHLLRALTDLDCAAEIVVVDDASAPPLEIDALRAATQGWTGRLELLRQERRRGAGAARNRGLEAVTASHVLFLDADDMPTPELPPLWRALSGRPFDFCLCRHVDSRAAALGHWGPVVADEDLWRSSGADLVALGRADAAARDLLVQTANYPWNKIYRTGFLRETGIRCSETLIHNDIELHWRSFAEAGAILTSNRATVLHRVAFAAGRLTNQRGAVRLGAFLPLERLAVRLLPDTPLAPAFLRFTSFLLDWIRGNLEPRLHPRFDRRAGHFLTRHCSERLFSRVCDQDPVLAAQLLCQIALGRGDAAGAPRAA